MTQSSKETCVLHLSDIHFCNADELDEDRRQHVLDGIPTVIHKLVKEKGPSWIPSTIAISGDLAFAGGDLNRKEYERPEKWLEQLISKLNEDYKDVRELTAKDIFICPGNHDIQRSKVREKLGGYKTKQELHTYAKNNLATARHLREQGEATFHYFNKLCLEKNYNSFDYFHEELKNAKYFGFKHHEATGLMFVIVNSSWFCRGYGKGDVMGPEDQGSLFLSKKMIESLFQKVQKVREKNNIPCVTLIHHPPDWLHWSERYRNDVSTTPAYDVIVNNSNVILSGHEHALGRRPDRIGGRALLVLSGASFHAEIAQGKSTEPDYQFNSFNLLKINKENLELEKAEFYYSLKEGFTEWKEFPMTDRFSIADEDSYKNFRQEFKEEFEAFKKENDSKWDSQNKQWEEQRKNWEEQQQNWSAQQKNWFEQGKLNKQILLNLSEDGRGEVSPDQLTPL